MSSTKSPGAILNVRSTALRAEGRSPEYKIAGSDFERAKHGPKGEIQDVFCNLSTPTKYIKGYNGDVISKQQRIYVKQV